MALNRELGKLFGEVRESYDEARPDYPRQLIHDVLQRAQIPEHGKILEIGCGSGKATVQFAPSGYEITALDPSPELLEIAKEHTQEYPNVSYLESTFEAADLQPLSYDLLVSAQAFHWVDPNVAYVKAYDVLRTNGTLALLWNNLSYDRLEFLLHLRGLFEKHSEYYRTSHGVIKEKNQEPIETSGLFKEIEKQKYARDLTYTREQCRKLIKSFSWVHAMTPDVSAAFREDLEKLLSSQPEALVLPWETTLVIGRKRKELPFS